MLWLLDNGLWLDHAFWKDDDFWQDYPEAVTLVKSPPPSRWDYEWFDRGIIIKKKW
jgi:hypothetical protein